MPFLPAAKKFLGKRISKAMTKQLLVTAVMRKTAVKQRTILLMLVDHYLADFSTR